MSIDITCRIVGDKTAFANIVAKKRHTKWKDVGKLGMLTRLEKISRCRELNFSLSRNSNCAINRWTDDQRSFNDG